MREDERTITPAPHGTKSSDWPALVARIVDDVTRIIQTEIRIFQAALTPIFSNAIDRFLANVVALVAYLAGGICLLAAFVFFLHQWLAWAPSLAITGALSVGAGYLSARIATVRADRSLAELERSFDRARMRAKERPGADSRSAQETIDATGIKP